MTAPQPPAAATDPSRRVIRPLTDFLQTESAGGILLAIGAAIALAWANSPWSDAYDRLWHTRAGLSFGSLALHLDLRHWVNDGLMAAFFLVVGLEIKRELIEGELRDRSQAILPALAALGGMLVPAAIFVALTAGTGDVSGWGVPMATDIALAVGVLGLLGSRVPSAGKVFLLALAIVDDLGAIAVIAIFYSDGLAWGWLAGAGVCVVAVLVARRRAASLTPVFVVLGTMLWLCLHEGGIHATIAGVIMGFLTPVQAHTHPDLIDIDELTDLSSVEHARATVTLARSSVSKVEWLEHVLHPWTSFVIVPVFALANAGVIVNGSAIDGALGSRAAWGVALGLLVGKPVGITVATWLACRAGAARLPAGVNLRMVAALGTLAGIGFTVSLFITELAFTDPDTAAAAKLAILVASLAAAMAGAAAVKSSAVELRGE